MHLTRSDFLFQTLEKKTIEEAEPNFNSSAFDTALYMSKSGVRGLLEGRHQVSW